jgi:predicted MFS family arabinose efflux permease
MTTPKHSAILSHSSTAPFQHPDVRRFAFFFAIAYFIQGLADLSSGLANQPVQYLLKERLELTATDSGLFWAIVGLGWTLKPIYGLLSDCIPFAGYHRKSYLLLVTLLAASYWLLLTVLPLSYRVLLVCLTFCAAALAFGDVMTDALMIEVGRPLGITGSFQAIQWAAISGALIIAQFGGGYLATHASVTTVFVLSTSFPLLLFLATLSYVREPIILRAQPSQTLNTLAHSVRSSTLWMTVGFLFLWNFSLPPSTPLLYYETDILKFSKIFIGVLGALTNVGSMLGAIMFFYYFSTMSLQRLLALAIALGVISTLGFLALIGPTSAMCLFFFSGLINQITHLAVLDLAARTCPIRAAGTVFALLMATLNLGRSGGTAVGGWLYDHIGLTPLILISAGTTALCSLIVPFLRENTRQ